MFGESLKAALTATARPSASLPVLETVQVHPGKVLSTDRYRLVRASYTMQNMDEEERDFEPFLLPASEAKKMLDLSHLLKVEKDEDGWITLTAILWSTGETVKRIFLPYTEQEFPPVEKLLDNWEPAKNFGPLSVAFNPAYLAAWTTSKLKRSEDNKTTPLKFFFSEKENDSVKVTYSDHFEALLMPYRKV